MDHYGGVLSEGENDLNTRVVVSRCMHSKRSNSEIQYNFITHMPDDKDQRIIIYLYNQMLKII